MRKAADDGTKARTKELPGPTLLTSQALPANSVSLLRVKEVAATFQYALIKVRKILPIRKLVVIFLILACSI